MVAAPRMVRTGYVEVITAIAVQASVVIWVGASFGPRFTGEGTERARSRATLAETYLDMRKVLQAAGSGADAVHPGYGFLAESAEFAQAVLNAGLTWIGPPPSAIRRLGDKLSARQAARQAGAPLLPAMSVPASDAALVAAFAGEHGLPVVIKAAAGGGGKGVAIARSAAEIPGACARAMQVIPDR